jgi:hypothetical protein
MLARRIDMNSLTQQPLTEVLSCKDMFLTAGKESQRAVDTCQFIEQGSTAVRWDGAVCPCIPLLHTSEHYLEHRLRTSHSHVFGTLEDQDLLEIWNGSDYHALRERLQGFNFSPCTFCNGCNLSLDNQEDCMANLAPTCGGSLWAQGFIQCP